MSKFPGIIVKITIENLSKPKLKINKEIKFGPSSPL
jgi:hypothetical protein